MDTLVSIEVVHSTVFDDCSESVERAFEWFRDVEQRCSRFDPVSELVRLCGHVGEPVEVTPLLFNAIEFALAVAAASGGAFDPAVGRRLETAGFNQNYRTGQQTDSGIAGAAGSTYRDVLLDATNRTVMFRRPVVLDLGAVAKGLAIDLAAQELRVFGDFAINAGGDLFVHGTNADGGPWLVGIRHPREDGAMFETVRVSDVAVCTSGDYERKRRDGEQGHHILEPGSGHSAAQTISVTVIAPTAMAADALATAAFVLGPAEGLAFLQREGVEGLIVSSSLDRHETPGMARYLGSS